MNTTRANITIPRFITVSAAILLGFSILMAAVSKQTGIGRTPDTTEHVRVRMLSFERQTDNSMLIRDSASQQVLDTLPSADEGFIPGALRGLLFERRRHDKPINAPFKLVASPGQGIALIDPTTGLYVQLEAFGRENARNVSRYLPVAHVSTL